MAKLSRKSSKALSPRSITPLPLTRAASLARLPLTSPRRLAKVPVRSIVVVGPSRRALAPVNRRDRSALPFAANVPSRAVSENPANFRPPSVAVACPSSQFFQSPLPPDLGAKRFAQADQAGDDPAGGRIDVGVEVKPIAVGDGIEFERDPVSAGAPRSRKRADAGEHLRASVGDVRAGIDAGDADFAADRRLGDEAINRQLADVDVPVGQERLVAQQHGRNFGARRSIARGAVALAMSTWRRSSARRPPVEPDFGQVEELA